MAHQISFSKILFVCLSISVWNAVDTAAFAQLASESESTLLQIDSSLPIESDTLLIEGETKIQSALETADLSTLDAPNAEIVVEDAAVESAEEESIEEESIAESVEEEPIAESIEKDEIVEDATTEETVVEKTEQFLGASSLGKFNSVTAETILADVENRNLANVASTFTVAGAAVSETSVPALMSALDSENALTQLQAADALWTLTGDRELVLPTLTAATDSRDSQVRELAIAALSQLGEQAMPAVPVLDDLLSNENSRTRQLAQDALTVIKSENRSRSILGIVVREGRRRLLPRAIRMITDLF